MIILSSYAWDDSTFTRDNLIVKYNFEDTTFSNIFDGKGIFEIGL